jgi:hypothetical protein
MRWARVQGPWEGSLGAAGGLGEGILDWWGVLRYFDVAYV